MIRNRTFAVIGLYRGVGATLFAINFACYLEKYHKAKVAVVELNDSGDFSKLAEDLQQYTYVKQSLTGFQVGNLDFYSSLLKVCKHNCLIEKYDFVIYDIGSKFVRHMEEIMDCNQKVILGNSLEWRICEFDKFFSYARQIDSYRAWEYIDMAMSNKGIHFVDNGKIKLKSMELIRQTFEVSDNAARIYQSLL